MLDIVGLTENQSRQYIDAQALMRAHADALVEAAQVRGSMIWREMRGVRSDSHQRCQRAKNHRP